MESNLMYLSSYICDITPVIISLANNAEKKGWAESHAGNFSIRCPGIKPPEQSCREILLDFPIPELNHETILLKKTGVRFRDCQHLQENSYGILHITKGGTKYQVWHGDTAETPFLPSTEWLTHLLIHQAILQNNLPDYALFHTHPTELIAITHRMDENKESLMNQIMQTMHSEYERYYPYGIGFLDQIQPGSLSLAEQTSKKILKQPLVLWKNHGSFSIGKDLHDAFDLVELANKIAQLFLMIYPGKTFQEIGSSIE